MAATMIWPAESASREECMAQAYVSGPFPPLPAGPNNATGSLAHPGQSRMLPVRPGSMAW
ncbi:hypothetical protein GCM10009569_02730 [Arthrobacter russicus]